MVSVADTARCTAVLRLSPDNFVTASGHFKTKFLNPTRQRGTGFLKAYPLLTRRVAVLKCSLDFSLIFFCPFVDVACVQLECPANVP